MGVREPTPPPRQQKSINVDYLPGDRVKLAAIDEPGRITAISVGFAGTMYQVAYFTNGQRYEVYLYPDEIKPAE
jgi:hypothetical protein